MGAREEEGKGTITGTHVRARARTLAQAHPHARTLARTHEPMHPRTHTHAHTCCPDALPVPRQVSGGGIVKGESSLRPAFRQPFFGIFRSFSN